MLVDGIYSTNVNKVKQELVRGFTKAQIYKNAQKMFSDKDVFVSTVEKLDESHGRDLYKYLMQFKEDMSIRIMSKQSVKEMAQDIEFLAKSVINFINKG